jgi:hypothetical protein
LFSHQIMKNETSMVLQVCNPSTQKAEDLKFEANLVTQQVQGQPEMHKDPVLKTKQKQELRM